jgi:hypothetical protein
VSVNGKLYKAETDRVGYYTISGLYNAGDSIVIQTPMHLYTESMPDNPNRIAFKYGPLVLAGTLGKTMPDPVYGTPVLMTDKRDPDQLLKPAGERSGQTSPFLFRTNSIGKPFDVSLKPFYQVYDEYYSVYWDYFTEAEWTARQKEYEDEKRREQEIAQITIDNFRVGEMQPERDHKLTATERSYVSDAIGRNGREARTGHHFQFVMKVDPDRNNELLLTYIGDDKDRKFDLLVDGKFLTTVEWKGGRTGKFYDLAYPLPLEMTRGRQEVTVRVEANHGKTAGRVFGVRTIRGKG